MTINRFEKVYAGPQKQIQLPADSRAGAPLVCVIRALLNESELPEASAEFESLVQLVSDAQIVSIARNVRSR